MPVILRPFTTMSMALKDFDDTDGNKTDIFGSVGAAGNLRFPGKGFQPPVDPVEKAAPKVDRANFDVKPDDDEKSVSFEEKQKKASFEDLVEFPCKFQIKIVGANQGEFVEDVLDSIGNVVKVERAKLPHSVRDKGKWRSITVRVPVESAQQLYEVYAAIDADPRVKFKF